MKARSLLFYPEKKKKKEILQAGLLILPSFPRSLSARQFINNSSVAFSLWSTEFSFLPPQHKKGKRQTGNEDLAFSFLFILWEHTHTNNSSVTTVTTELCKHCSMTAAALSLFSYFGYYSFTFQRLAA